MRFSYFGLWPVPAGENDEFYFFFPSTFFMLCKIKRKWKAIKHGIFVNHILKLYAEDSFRFISVNHAIYCMNEEKKRKKKKWKPWKRIYRPCYRKCATLYMETCICVVALVSIRNLTSFALASHIKKKNQHYFQMSTANYSHTPNVISINTENPLGSLLDIRLTVWPHFMLCVEMLFNRDQKLCVLTNSKRKIEWHRTNKNESTIEWKCERELGMNEEHFWPCASSLSHINMKYRQTASLL